MSILPESIKSLLPSRFLTKREFERQHFEGFNERPIEFEFVFRQIGRYYPKTVLDVGTGTTALPHLIRNCGCLVTASDNVRDYWPAGMTNRHYHIVDDDITQTRFKQKFDMITCVSVLEHIGNHAAAVANMLSLLTPKGHLVMSFPYTEQEYVPDVYKLPGSNAAGKNIPYVTQSYSRKELSSWCEAGGGRIVEQEYWQFFTGKTWTLGEECFPPIRSSASGLHQITCVLIEKI